MVQSFKDFKDEYHAPRYSRRDLDIAIEQAIKSCTVNRVIQKTRIGNVALQILAIHDYPGVGRTIIVR